MKTKSFFLLVAVSLFMLACKKDEPEETKPAETSNKAPTVTLTSPTTGGAGAAPQTETLSATASDEDGTITKVEFYVGTTLVGTDTNSPYTMQYTFNSNGFFQVKAVATDNNGASTTSSVFDYGIGI